MLSPWKTTTGESKGYLGPKWKASRNVSPSYSVFGGPHMSIVQLKGQNKHFYRSWVYGVSQVS